MRFLFGHIAILLFLIGVSSCVEIIEMEGMDSYYVVECLLTEGSRQGLRVCTEQAFPPLTDIEATISDLTAGGTQYEFSPLQNSLLSGYIDLTPIPGHEYMLSIRIDSLYLSNSIGKILDDMVLDIAIVTLVRHIDSELFADLSYLDNKIHSVVKIA